MIAARLLDPEGNVTIMLVLEPGNIEKMKGGNEILKPLNEFIPELPFKVGLLFCYTPDAPWVVDQMQKRHLSDALSLAKVIEESLPRTPIILQGRETEEVPKVTLFP